MRNRIFIRLITLVALFGIAAVFFNLIGYRHIHLGVYGGVISHAHPYKQEHQNGFPVDTHQHTSFEMIFWAIASDVLDFTLLVIVIFWFIPG